MDDGVGVYISRRIKTSEMITSITVEVSIENYIGKINSLNPDILILIYCADMNVTAGTIKVLTFSQLADLTFNTHNISLRHLAEFFRMPVYILAIQAEKIDFGENISYIVKKAAHKILKHINEREVYHGSRISM